VVFLKPGLMVLQGWLEGLLQVVESESNIGVVGGLTVNQNGLIWHIGIAFDVNQSPFCLYRLMPAQFSAAQNPRHYRALEIPFMTSRDLFSRLGGFSTEFSNRFEDIDFCLRITERADLKAAYTPRSIVKLEHVSWLVSGEADQLNRIRFYSKWTGYLWQDDERYLSEDGLTHDRLSYMYRELAVRIAHGASQYHHDSCPPPAPGHI
jgi:GT2 family glycosyltransferase